MKRGILHQADYRPLFSGHETFPPRYGWLKKAYDSVALSDGDLGNRAIFLDDSAITRFGVGRNMVKSMRHWSTACGVIAEDEKTGQLTTTKLGDFLFGRNGVDPYLENPASLWLLHWQLCSGENPRCLKTTWFWSINYFAGTTFQRKDLVEGLLRLAEQRGWPRVSQTTVQRDVECFVRTYENRINPDSGFVEDNLESIFSELGLVKGSRAYFQFIRGEKYSIPDSVFVYALSKFWDRQPSLNTLSYEAIAHEVGSPGRVLLLDEFAIADRLLAMEELTSGRLLWSETAGLRQALRPHPLVEDELFSLLKDTYAASRHVRNV